MLRVQENLTLFINKMTGDGMNFFGLIILVLDIVAVVDCWKSNLDQNKKILWTLLIVILPLAGLILYYLLAKKSP